MILQRKDQVSEKIGNNKLGFPKRFQYIRKSPENKIYELQLMFLKNNLKKFIGAKIKFGNNFTVEYLAYFSKAESSQNTDFKHIDNNREGNKVLTVAVM